MHNVQSMGKRTLDAGQKNQAIPLREIVRYTELRSQSDRNTHFITHCYCPHQLTFSRDATVMFVQLPGLECVPKSYLWLCPYQGLSQPGYDFCHSPSLRVASGMPPIRI